MLKEQQIKDFNNLSRQIQVGPNPYLETLLEKYGGYEQETLIRARVLCITRQEEIKRAMTYDKRRITQERFEEELALVRKKIIVVDGLLSLAKERDKKNYSYIYTYIKGALLEFGIVNHLLTEELATNLRLYSDKQAMKVKEGYWDKPVSKTPIANLLFKLMCKARKYNL